VGRNTSGLKRGGPGRPKGVPNKATQEMRALALELLNDPAYRKKFWGDWRKRKVHPGVEQMVYHYGHGKPKDTLSIEGAAPVLVVDELTPADIVELKAERDV
jgi:hypothetical protein